MRNHPQRLIALAALCALGACDHAKPAPAAAAPPPANAPANAKPAAASPAQPAHQAQPTAAATSPELMQDPGAEHGLAVTRAVAVLEPTKGSHAHGTVTFTAHSGGGLDVKAEIMGLTPGVHAFHVHEFGDCSGEDGKSAGTHFNFQGSSENPGKVDRITGNLGELKAGHDGTASVSTVIEHASLQGRYSLIGRSVVVHDKGNDEKSPPMGAAGGRAACGVIGVADSNMAQRAASAPKTHHGKG